MREDSLFNLLNITISKINETLGPLHSLLSKNIQDHSHNTLFNLPKNRIIDLMKETDIYTSQKDINEYGIWGLRLKIQNKGSTLISNMYISSKVWEYLKEKLKTEKLETIIGIKNATDDDEIFFRPIEPQYRNFRNELLLCAVGPNAKEALEVALNAEKEIEHDKFDDKFDMDGFTNFCN